MNKLFKFIWFNYSFKTIYFYLQNCLRHITKILLFAWQTAFFLFVFPLLYTKACVVFINFIPRVCSPPLLPHTHTCAVRTFTLESEPSHSNAITIFTECYSTWHSLSMNVYNTVHCIHVSKRFVFVHTPVNRSCVKKLI